MASWNTQEKYELNSSMKWDFTNPIPDGIPVWVLAEEDTCDPTQPPSIFRAIYIPDAPQTRRLRLLDYDPELQEDALSGNNWTIVAWRLMTDHGGTWDKFYSEHGITEYSNWVMTLDRQEKDENMY